MKVHLSILTAISLICLNSGQAQTVDFAADQGKSKYQTLLDAYENADTTATIADFPKIRDCVTISAKAPDTIGGSFFIPMERLVTYGKSEQVIPAHGPLFPEKIIPGTPDITKTILTSGGEWTLKMSADQFAVFSNNQTDTDFEINVAKNNLGIYGDVSQNGVRISIRKKENYFPYVVQINLNSKHPETVFSGYCYEDKP